MSQPIKLIYRCYLLYSTALDIRVSLISLKLNGGGCISHIIDDDRRLNAQGFEEQFYQPQIAVAVEEMQEEKVSEIA